MKDKMWLCNKKNVLHQGYEDKNWLGIMKNVLHPGYEGQKLAWHQENCPSSGL
jgi:hypothetical protein